MNVSSKFEVNPKNDYDTWLVYSEFTPEVETQRNILWNISCE